MVSIMKITKLVLPVAGRGKRLLPLTEKTPKNLICVNGKPLLEYALEEAVASGIKDAILIVNPAHRKKFETYIRKNSKKFPALRFHLREQSTPGGNGHALISAYDLVKNGPFAVRFCDDILLTDKKPALRTLIDIFETKKLPVILLEKVPRNLVYRFGVVGVRKIGNQKKDGGRMYWVTKIIEKPRPKDAPSNLIIPGAYVMTPRMLRALKSVAETLPVIADDALPLAVALQIELIMGGKVLGWEFPGKRLDCGTLERLKKTEEFLKKRRG
jgi:UTP--glucose-1-phosphate uridylyltransferase